MDALALSIVPAVKCVEPYTFDVPIDNPKGLGSLYRRQSMALPHEVFAFLYREHRAHFHKIFGTDKLVDFWGHQNTERLERHPFFERSLAAQSIPIRLYGDDVSVAKTVTCLILLWTSSATLRLPAIEAWMPCSSTRLQGTDIRTTEEVYRVLRWSLEALCAGKYPTTDHNGAPWAAESTRAGQTGDLAEGFRGLIYDIVGDWKWLAEAVGFKAQKRYYNCSEICHRCGATEKGPTTYKTLKDDAACLQILQSMAEFAAQVNTELSKLPGFHVQETPLWDWMHCSPLGIEGISNGATLLELVLAGHWGRFGGEWKVRIGIALKRAYADFKIYCQNARLEHSQQQFTTASLGVAGGQEYLPVLKGKAHNQTCVTRWLSELLRNDTATQHNRNRSRVLWALASFNNMFSNGPMWLSDQDAQHLELARKTFFGAWARLAEEPDSNWTVIPKHHAAHHLLLDAVHGRRNPGGFWCYSGEHCMGVTKKSLGGNYQRGLDDRILKAALVRFGLSALD